MTDQDQGESPHRHCTQREEGNSVSTHAGVRSAQPTECSIDPLMGQQVDPSMVGGTIETQLPCRQHPADLWFAELPEEVEAAKSLCLDCPIRALCLEQALQRQEPWGVWGGQLLVQGTVVPRKRPRGRPRKNPVAA